MNEDGEAAIGLLVPPLARVWVGFAVVLIAFRIVGYGFQPSDDALRHAAKVVSGKDWNEILVLRDDMGIDSHPGWHAILGVVLRLTGQGTDTLVAFSVAFLFVLFSAGPLLLLRRPEAWILALVVAVTARPSWTMRLFLGRPYLVSMGYVVVLAILWPRVRAAERPWATAAAIFLLTMLTTWIHGQWYLLALPGGCFLLARRWRGAAWIGPAMGAGVLAGAALTGHPYGFLRQTLVHMLRAVAQPQYQRFLVGEFRGGHGDFFVPVAILALLAWRRLQDQGRAHPHDTCPVTRDPILLLVALCWIMGHRVSRFWGDWGMPAAAVWIALEVEKIMQTRIKRTSWKRLALAAASTCALYLAVTTDVNDRWTENLNREYLRREDPQHAEWLPEPGGIVYSDSIGVFYRTFFANPHAPWRYLVGFEPTLMPPEDLAVFRKILWNWGDPRAFVPWVKRMRPADRLILLQPYRNRPNIRSLDWHYAASETWIGRLPREREAQSRAP
ncbi:MAG: hypothetical protein JXR37_22700 [Kiritimatiellae bacterium]|nr:hypothetical protein [Kiritimatiellia bacterium]